MSALGQSVARRLIAKHRAIGHADGLRRAICESTAGEIAASAQGRNWHRRAIVPIDLSTTEILATPDQEPPSRTPGTNGPSLTDPQPSWAMCA
jgi:hypothetical protein